MNKELVVVRLSGKGSLHRAVAVCPRCKTKHVVSAEVRKVYCSCPFSLLIDRG